MKERPTRRRGPILWLTARSRTFWIGCAICLPILYVLSHGVWWSLSAHCRPPQVVAAVFSTFYSPIWKLYYADMIPEEAFGLFMDYNQWCLSLGGELPADQTLQPILSLHE